MTLTLHAAPRQQVVLSSASRGISSESARIEPAGTGCVILKETLRGGRQDGVEVITVDNGKLRFAVSPTRGMGLLWARLGSVRLAWDSPVKETIHPKYLNLESRGGLGWLEGFNELMVRCGLEFAGHPGKDKFVNNVGDEAEMDLTLHGKIGNIPASEVELLVEEDGTVRLRGRVDERMFYGPKLELWTEISTRPGSDSFTIHDTIHNQGAHDQEFQLIYHANYGPSLLEEGARFVGAIERVTPFNAHAAKSAASWAEYDGPTKGFIERVYCLLPLADPAGQTMILLRNRAGNQAVSMAYSVRELPYLTLWKNTAALEEGYVTGLEPGTGFPMNRRFERKAGRVPKLKPGEIRSFTVEYRVHDSGPSVEAAVKAIAKIQGTRQPTVDSQPLPRLE